MVKVHKTEKKKKVNVDNLDKGRYYIYMRRLFLT